jgi:hypothetical protein
VGAVGLTLTDTGGGSVTVTVAVPDFVGSALLVAVTRQVFAPSVGAVKKPLCVTEPQSGSGTDQVTVLLEVLVTVASKVCVPPVERVAVDGVTLTLTLRLDRSAEAL